MASTNALSMTTLRTAYATAMWIATASTASPPLPPAYAYPPPAAGTSGAHQCVTAAEVPLATSTGAHISSAQPYLAPCRVAATMKYSVKTIASVTCSA